MPFLIVPDTRAPTRTPPRNSITAAAQQACSSVRDLDPTEVANDYRDSDQDSNLASAMAVNSHSRRHSRLKDEEGMY